MSAIKKVSVNYLSALHALGFEHIALSFYTPDFKQYDFKENDIVSSRLLAWHQHFKQSKYDAIDEIGAETKKKEGIVLWDLHQQRKDSTNKTQQMITEAIDYGLSKGISIADTHASGASYIMVLHSPEADKITQIENEKIHAARWYTHKLLNDIAKEKISHERQHLTSKELCILENMLRYDTVTEIAKVLHRSPRTIIFHQENIKRKFALKNKTDLVLLALRLFGC